MIASGSLDLLNRLAVNGTALIVQRWYDGSALACGCWDMHDCARQWQTGRITTHAGRQVDCGRRREELGRVERKVDEVDGRDERLPRLLAHLHLAELLRHAVDVGRLTVRGLAVRRLLRHRLAVARLTGRRLLRLASRAKVLPLRRLRLVRQARREELRRLRRLAVRLLIRRRGPAVRGRSRRRRRVGIGLVGRVDALGPRRRHARDRGRPPMTARRRRRRRRQARRRVPLRRARRLVDVVGLARALIAAPA